MSKRQIGYAEDENAGSYKWQMAAVYKDNGRYYIITDGGCSCNGPMSDYTYKDAVVGPAATLGGLLDELNVDKDKHHKWVKEAFVSAVNTINAEGVAAIKKVLGL